jgi:hypothetical protein
MEITFMELGEFVTEKASETRGMLTHFALEPEGGRHYLFQPHGLNPETGLPISSFWITESRIVGGTKITVDLPTEVLGTQVEDKASGYKGLALDMVYHINGCVHFNVKPKGTIAKTGATIAAQEFDIRRLKGEAIPELSKEEIKKSQEEKPSPMESPDRSVK